MRCGAHRVWSSESKADPISLRLMDGMIGGHCGDSLWCRELKKHKKGCWWTVTSREDNDDNDDDDRDKSYDKSQADPDVMHVLGRTGISAVQHTCERSCIGDVGPASGTRLSFAAAGRGGGWRGSLETV